MHQKPIAPIYLIGYKLLTDRQIGIKLPVGFSDDLAKKLYTSLDAYESNQPLNKYEGSQGGIFNLEFSLDGRILTAACEKKSVILFDAANQKPYKIIKHAHNDCVNCIKYLNSTSFASCSDDHTIKIWDLRKPDSPINILNGHRNWVKNIEYMEQENMLISSAFDGGIHGWDLNNLTDYNEKYNILYFMSDVMRTKVTSDGTKMALSSTNGYIVIIHDLNITSLYQDISNFNSHVYRYLQQDNGVYNDSSICSYLLCQERKRNRIELIDDFPNRAKMITSLQLHPKGYCAVSRNINNVENEEWTSVHDISARPSAFYDDAFKVRENTSTNCPTTRMFPPTNTFSENQQEDLQQFVRYKNLIFLNIPRLTNYIQEDNSAEGYIKEQSFSNDGRIICSPFEKGVRLLTFNEQTQELAYCMSDQSSKLVILTEMINYHSDDVVSCKFSPIHYQLVSGCLSGEIVWYKPIL